MRIAVAFDSFKGCVDGFLASTHVARVLASHGHDAFPLPLADGGEGTAATLARLLPSGLPPRCARVPGPLGDMVDARWHPLASGAAVDMAAACGLPLLPPERRNPWLTSTLGLGRLLASIASLRGAPLRVGLGGSATCDGGAGLLQAFGARFFRSDGSELTSPMCGGLLAEVARVDLSPMRVPAPLEFLCDVESPLCGPDGAALRFSPQKGADPSMARRLESAMLHWAAVLARDAAIEPGDILNAPGAGAAGGIGCVAPVVKARMLHGARLICSLLAPRLRGATLVITGEGRTDRSTLLGKAPFELMKTARAAGIPVLLLSGSLTLPLPLLLRSGFSAALPVNPPGAPLADSMRPSVCLRRLSLSSLKYVNKP